MKEAIRTQPRSKFWHAVSGIQQNFGHRNADKRSLKILVAKPSIAEKKVPSPARINEAVTLAKQLLITYCTSSAAEEQSFVSMALSASSERSRPRLFHSI